MQAAVPAGVVGRTTAVENAASVWPLGKLLLLGGRTGTEPTWRPLSGRSRWTSAFTTLLTPNETTPEYVNASAARRLASPAAAPCRRPARPRRSRSPPGSTARPPRRPGPAGPGSGRRTCPRPVDPVEHPTIFTAAGHRHHSGPAPSCQPGRSGGFGWGGDLGGSGDLDRRGDFGAGLGRADRLEVAEPTEGRRPRLEVVTVARPLDGLPDGRRCGGAGRGRTARSGRP